MEYDRRPQYNSSDRLQRRKAPDPQPDTAGSPMLKRGGLSINIANIPAYPPSREAQGQLKSVKDDAQPGIVAQAQTENLSEKMSYGDKLIAAAKMVPDLLVGDAKAAFLRMISDPGFIVQLGALAGVFAALQAIPGIGQAVDAVLLAGLGFSGGWHLLHYLLNAYKAEDEAGLKAAAVELKELVEIIGVVAIIGALQTASRLLSQLKLKGVQAAEAGTIRNVNPGYPKAPGRTNNCVNCSIATDATLKGRPASALPGKPTPTAVLEKLYGKKFTPTKGVADITQKMQTAGPKSNGIVWGRRIVNGKEQTGHVFNVVNQNGVVRFLDGQTGRPAKLEGFQQYLLLRTN
jgi:hypothetical protein